MVEWLDTIVHGAGPLGLLVLLFSAAFEYVFPPFPGDTVTLLGGIYAVRGELPVALVFVAVMGGSLLGATADYALGRWIGARLSHAPHEKHYLRYLTREQILEWEGRFRRRGRLWLLANRFLPGIRGPIFLAAGMSQMPYARVLLWGGLSTLLWNALLFGTGYAVGGRAERLETILSGYSHAVWTVLAALAVVWAARMLWRRRKGGRLAAGKTQT